MTHNHRLTPDRFERAVRGAHRSWCLACQGETVDDDPSVPVTVLILGERDCAVTVMDDDGQAGLFERVLSCVAAYGSAAHVEATIFCSTGRMTTLDPDEADVLCESLAIVTLGVGPEGHIVSLLSSESEGIREELRRPLYGRVLEAMRIGMEFAAGHGQEFLNFLGQSREELRQLGIDLETELPDVGCVLDRLLAADDEGFPWPATD